MIRKYRKKPVDIEAIQLTEKNYPAVKEFTNSNGFMNRGGVMIIKTLEGDMECKIGAFIIKGLKGEFYPCDEEIFWMSYEEVSDEA
jgi:hypothetical protein